MRIIIQAYKDQISGDYAPASQIELNGTNEVEIINLINYHVIQIEDIIKVNLNKKQEDASSQT